MAEGRRLSGYQTRSTKEFGPLGPRAGAEVRPRWHRRYRCHVAQAHRRIGLSLNQSSRPVSPSASVRPMSFLRPAMVRMTYQVAPCMYLVLLLAAAVQHASSEILLAGPTGVGPLMEERGDSVDDGDEGFQRGDLGGYSSYASTGSTYGSTSLRLLSSNSSSWVSSFQVGSGALESFQGNTKLGTDTLLVEADRLRSSRVPLVLTPCAWKPIG